jgi:hypothetical protein
MSSDPPPLAVMAFAQLLISARLLFVVSSSKLFGVHLKLLNNTDSVLSLPTEAHMQIYTLAFKRLTSRHSDRLVKDRDLINDLQCKVDDLNSTSSRSCPKSVQASATEESDAEVNDEVLDRFRDTDAKIEVEVNYRMWIMNMVDHFAAIRALERVSVKLPPDGNFNFSIVGLNRPSLLSSSWDTMVGEIRMLCQDGSLLSKVSLESQRPLPPADLADKVIRIMETKIEEYKDSNTTNKTSARFESTVYSFFKKLLKKPVGNTNFTGCGHCETILMAIIHRISNKDDLDFSLKACSLELIFI